jgi:hypothetical protein
MFPAVDAVGVATLEVVDTEPPPMSSGVSLHCQTPCITLPQGLSFTSTHGQSHKPTSRKSRRCPGSLHAASTNKGTRTGGGRDLSYQ